MGMLFLSIFIGRPYCRFLCPYSVLLNFISRFSKQHTTITPGKCIQCKLCEDSCAFDAILKPNPGEYKEEKEVSVKRIFLHLVLLPVLIITFGFIGYLLHGNFSKLNKTVSLAEEIYFTPNQELTLLSIDVETFQASGKETKELYLEAKSIIKKFKVGSMLFGGFIGLILGIKLINLSINPSRKDYIPDKANCVSCGRCYKYCPVKE